MGYLGEDLSIPQILFALNAKLSQQVRPFEYVTCASRKSDVLMLASRNVPEAELSVYKHQVKTALATINSGLNAHKPVARLPADILLSIPTYFDFDVIQFDLVNLTHVFRYWRETFVSASSLWSTIHIRALNGPLLILSLERSGSAPIRMHIRGHNDYDRFASVAAPIVTARQNWYDTLCLDLEWEEAVAVSQLTSNSVSRLRVLSLNVTATEQDFLEPVHPPFSRASALQELTLRLISLDISTILDCLQFANLTVLSFLCTAPISQSNVLDFLRVSPRLKRVGLDFRRLITDQMPCLPALFSELRQLRIEATTSGDSHLQLFTNLVCPIAEDVIITVQPVYFGRMETSPFQSSWGFFPRSSKVHTIGVQVQHSHIETIYSLGLLYGEASRFEVSFRFLTFGARNPREFSVFPELLDSLRPLSLNAVVRLSITGIDPSTITPSIRSEISSSIRELLADTENLEVLTISNGCLPVVCQTLAPRPIPPTVLCPRLDSIEVLFPTQRDSPVLLSGLTAMCRARAAAGFAVRDVSSTSQVSNFAYGS